MAKRYATDAEVLEVAPSMASAPSTLRDTYREIAENFVGLSVFGNASSLAHALVTAHLLASLGGYGGGGIVTAKTIGRLSVSYAAPAVSDEALGATRWGAAFVSLRDTLPLVGVVGRSTTGRSST